MIINSERALHRARGRWVEDGERGHKLAELDNPILFDVKKVKNPTHKQVGAILVANSIKGQVELLLMDASILRVSHACKGYLSSSRVHIVFAAR